MPDHTGGMSTVAAFGVQPVVVSGSSLTDGIIGVVWFTVVQAIAGGNVILVAVPPQFESEQLFETRDAIFMRAGHPLAARAAPRSQAACWQRHWHHGGAPGTSGARCEFKGKRLERILSSTTLRKLLIRRAPMLAAD